MNKSDFLDELGELEEAFASMQPELELVVRDQALGIEGYVVVWNSAPGARGPLGPCGKGGTRISPDVTLDTVRMLAQQMALKNAASDLAFGGAKSGLRADPAAPGFEKQYRRFVRLVSPILRENGGIFGGFGFDIGARPEHALWACDELGSTRCFTGKPVDLGGTDYDREGIAGLGVAVAARTLFESLGKGADGARFAIQGMGAMGSAVFRYFTQFGGEPRAVSDPKLGGTVVFSRPPSPALAEALAHSRFDESIRLLDAEGFERRPVEEVLYEEVDVLFPCAFQDSVRADNAARVRAKCIVEGANSPCTPEAHTALADRGVVILPGYMVNAGGIIAAYVEMTSDVSPEENLRTRANVRRAKELAEEKVDRNVRSLLSVADSAGVDTVKAARYLALTRALEGLR